MRKKCIVWGTRAAGQQLAKQASEIGYEVVAYCSSTKFDQEKRIDNIPVISPRELQQLYCAEKVNSVLLGVKNPAYRSEIEAMVAEMPPLIASAIYRETDFVENAYLKIARANLKYRWNVPFEQQAETWLQNFMIEVKSWVRDDANADGIYHKVYMQRLENTDFLGIDASCAELAKTLSAGSVVMDIGCGLVSLYGTRLPSSEKIQLLAVDPLAPFYNRINQKYACGKAGICQFGLFEFIADFYKENSCDAILINNALDHCIDPYKSFLECLYILKCGGIMRLTHRRAEAVYEAYHGLHKWNIDCTSQNKLIFWNQENAINVSEQLKRIADVKVMATNEDAPRVSQNIIVEVVKKSSFSLGDFFTVDQEQRQLAFLVNGLMNWIANCRENDYLESPPANGKGRLLCDLN